MFLTEEIGIGIIIVAIKREQFEDNGKMIRPNVSTQHKNESKHYTVDFMCILHLLYFSSHLFTTKSEKTLDSFSNMIRNFTVNVG